MSLTRRNHSALMALIQSVYNIASAVGNRETTTVKVFQDVLN